MGAKKSATPEEVTEWVRLYKGGLSLREVADAVERPYTTVYAYLRADKRVKMRKPNGHGKNRVPKAEIREMRELQKAGIAQRKIAKTLGRSPDTVNRYLTRRDI